MLHKSIRTLFAALIFVPCTFAQQQSSTSQPRQPSVAQQQAAAPRRQQQQPGAPDVERLRKHVAHLASDKLEGRRTGTPGAEEAAAYVARELAAAGVPFAPPTPSGYLEGRTDMGYVRGFPYVAAVEAGKNNALTLRPRADVRASSLALDLRLGEDWMPLGFSASARVADAPVAFAGHAIRSDERGRDDFKDVSGKAAVAFLSTPDGDNPHGAFARFNDLRLRAAAARAAGAKALVFVARADDFKHEKLSRLAYDNSAGGGGDAGLPVVVVSRQAAAQMLGLGGVAQLTELERSLSAMPPQTQSAAHAAGQASAASAPSAPAHTQHAPSHPAASLPQPVASLTLSTDVVRRRAPAFNVVGVIEGSDPRLKNEYVVIGAHYDHLGRGGAGSRAAREGEIHHGADDNASGTAALLELARLLAAERAGLRRSVVLIAFGGEEEGLLGSHWYASNPVFPLEKTVAMINLDMVGRLKNERLMIGGVGTAAEWRRLVEGVNNELDVKVAAAGAGEAGAGVPVVTASDGRTVATASPRTRFTLALSEDGYGPSDHSSFYAKRVPVLFFFTGTHEDYHLPSDTAERINYEGLARVTSFVLELVRELQAADARPTFTEARVETTARATGFRVYLGTVPGYGESADGLKLEGVREGSPAERAGLKAGDVIVRLAGRDVRNVYDYTNALSAMQPGQEYEVEVTRGAERLKLKVTPAARK